jgi:hypothetical protein
MKASNKILLGIFLAVILLTTGIQLIIFAKYKRGDFVPFQRETAIPLLKVDLPGTRFVSITGLGGVELINSDTAKFEIDKNKTGRITYHMKNDTLFIHGDSTLSDEQLKRGSRNYQMLKLYLPASVPVRTAYSGIMIRGKIDSTKAPSFNIHLGSDSYFNMDDPDKEYLHVNQLMLSCENSKAELQDRMVINNLNLTLVNSSVNNKFADIKHLTLDVDSNSSINLSGNSIRALK